ncbi:MAG: hypothetical protein QM733_10985 [Ilumatobacteraceae bacterium]
MAEVHAEAAAASLADAGLSFGDVDACFCAEGRPSTPRCDDCGELIWYSLRFCPFCRSRSVTYVDVSGRGTVDTFAIIIRGASPLRDTGPRTCWPTSSSTRARS